MKLFKWLQTFSNKRATTNFAFKAPEQRDSPLEVAQRILVFGGYDYEPAWLGPNSTGYTGSVLKFIPGQNNQSACVVKLDDELILPNGVSEEQAMEIRGRFLVLELGHTGDDWATVTPRIHVELCATCPESKTWSEREQGVWVESHATYRIIE